MFTTAKPWGREEILEENQRYVVKRITILAKSKLSLHLHEKRHETIVAIAGFIKVEFFDHTGQRERYLRPGDFMVIPPKMIHRLITLDEESVAISTSTSEKNDLVRLSDDYGRV